MKRLAAELQQSQTKQGGSGLRVESAVVTATTNAAQVVGKAALCTVRWRGSTYPAAYPDGYTPVVNHVVFVLVQPPQGLVIFMKPKIA
jgi:cyanophycinase-like exopeptidase